MKEKQKEKVEQVDHKIWNNDKEYGELLSERATGKRDDMECAKFLCSLLKPLYRKQDSILDVGCAAGHYLRTLRTRLDTDINYTGCDATPYYIELARKTFDNVPFEVEDIYNLSFEDNTFDIVLCNNVLLHLPPLPAKPIQELIRVSKRYVIMRVPIGKIQYIIKEVKPKGWNYFNMYTLDDYYKMIGEHSVINKKDTSVVIEEYDNRDETTKTINNVQVSGNLLLDWRFIIIDKKVIL